MASNDQWPPVASPSCGKSQNKGKSNPNKKKSHRQMVLDLVTEMFATTLEQEVIVSLAQNCNWELQSTIDALIALSATVDTPMTNAVDENLKIMTDINQENEHHHQLTNDGLSDEYFKMNPTELKEQLDGFSKFEQLKKKSTRNRMDFFKGNIAKLDRSVGRDQTNIEENKNFEASWDSITKKKNRGAKAKAWQSNDSYYSSNSSMHLHETQSNKYTNMSQSFECNKWPSITPPPTTPQQNPINSQAVKSSSKSNFKTNKSGNARQLCGLQVHYRSPGMDSSSDDDDADVVVEEEFDYCVPSEPAVTVSQFLSSSVKKSASTHQPNQAKFGTYDLSSCTSNKKNNAAVKNIIQSINNGDKILIILRGLPGAGKSNLARTILSLANGNADPSFYIFSADDYFRRRNGSYMYDPTKLSDAHRSNIERVSHALASSTTPVIVDNTNLEAWEMRPYAALAVQRGYFVEILDVDTPWADNVNVLAKMNVHGVPKKKISDMQMRYERGIDGQTLLERYALIYPDDRRPVRNKKVNKFLYWEADEVKGLGTKDIAASPKIDQVANTIQGGDKTQESNMNMAAPPTIDQVANTIQGGDKTQESNMNMAVPPNIDQVTNTSQGGNKTHESNINMAIPPNIDQVANTIQRGDKTQESNMNTGDDVNKTLLQYLNESTNEVGAAEDERTKTTTDIGEKVSEKLENASRSPKVDDHVLQPLGAIGSERKNSLVHSESVGLSREAKSDSDRVNNENVLSQCWDFTLSLNGETLHSDHRDHHHSFFVNSPGSPINADDMREQDKEFGKKEQYVTMNPSLSTKPFANLTHLNYSDFETNNMNEFFNALTKEYDDAVRNFERKKSTVIITEIIGDISNCEEVMAIEETFDHTQICCYRNGSKIATKFDKEQFGNIPINAILSIDEVTSKDCNNLRMLFTNKKKNEFGTISEVRDSRFVKTRDSGDITNFIMNEEYKQSLHESSIVTFLNKMKTSILESNTTANTYASEGTDGDVQKNDIPISVSQKNNEEINHDRTSSDAQQEESSDRQKNNTISTNPNEKYSDNSHQPILNNTAIRKIELNTQKNAESNETYDSPMSESSSSSSQKLDNINRITWEESPFPLDDIIIPELVPEKDISPEKISTQDASTITTYYDFNVAYVGGTSEPGYRVMNAFSRHISNGMPVMHIERPPVKLMLDKSSMTGDVFDREGNPDSKNDDDNVDRISNLIELFPHIPRDCLTEVYEKLCMKNFDWTVEMLLDGVPDDVTIKNSETTNSNNCEISKIPHETNESITMTEKFLEDANDYTEDNIDHAACTENQIFQQQSPLCHQDQEETLEIAIDDEFSNDSDYNHVLKTDISDGSTPSPVSENPQESSDDTKPPEVEETIELNLGCEFVRTLENQFGHPDFQIPAGFKPVITIKKSIAEHLYASWIESMYQQLNLRHEQLDQMIAKDAEFAKSLEQELELTEGQGSSNDRSEDSVPNFEEIMDMELALASMKNEVKSVVSKGMPDDMAARLSRQMLYESLPDMDPETFDEILKAHNGNFKETFDIIESNTGRSITPSETVHKSTNSKLQELKKDGNHNTDTIGAKRSSPIIVVQDNKCSGNRSPYKNAVRKVADLRQEAQRQFSLRVDNFNKASEAYRRGYPQVAAYYSQVARLHSENIEAVQNDAAVALVDVHIYGNDEHTLDLHNLFVAQALQALDKFLDYHVDKLAKSSKKKSTTVYIITGRGARSNNGTSKIKPAVSRRLLMRNIRYVEENPGCLKVNLHRKNGSTD